ncbi:MULTISPECIES: DUF2490 domain-containing protein [Chryseobacterium]|uniref:DUF2490 domain-containing protein n=1 Tax=Chryseobacterium TaxID=59732 RepID=UPI001D150FFB|nr:DUF2490 domain-containing protein [Chryseobacterium sp. X308]MCC3215563.1 DUF2490 domain-containing protein [Chryseobacterium sp. X308]
MISKISLLHAIAIPFLRTFTLLLFLSSLPVCAQTVNEFNSWWYYTGTYKILPRINVQTMYSWNRNDFVRNWQQSKLKIGADYEFNRHWKIAAGYEWIILYPYGEFPISKKRAEHRIYEELKHDFVLGKFKLSTSVRAEHRFLNTDVTHRIRLQTGVKFPVWKQQNQSLIGLSFYEQMILNTDKQLVNQYLAQNRLYGGADIFLDKSLTLGLG